MNDFKPLHDYVLLTYDVPEEEVTKSGLILKKRDNVSGHLFGTVLAIGSGKDKSGIMAVKVGDRVMYEKRFKLTKEINDNLYILIKEEYIIGVIDNE